MSSTICRSTLLGVTVVSFAVIYIVNGVGAQVPDLEVLCGQYSVYCASSCQTYQQQCASTYGEMGSSNNNIPSFGIISGPTLIEINEQQENRLHTQFQPPAQNRPCKRKNAACSTNKDCCLEFYCKHHKQADGRLAKIGTCQIPFYLNVIVPRASDESEASYNNSTAL